VFDLPISNSFVQGYDWPNTALETTPYIAVSLAVKILVHDSHGLGSSQLFTSGLA